MRRAILVDDDLERRRLAGDWLRANEYEVIEAPGHAVKEEAALRDRDPELYQALLGRYEEAVKKVLLHRIYKINDDAFEPFRRIAKELFLANASARDAIELHYHTLRKIAPAPESPKSRAYLEVGRTTIIGLMGDLLAYYRDAFSKSPSDNTNSHPTMGMMNDANIK